MRVIRRCSIIYKRTNQYYQRFPLKIYIFVVRASRIFVTKNQCQHFVSKLRIYIRETILRFLFIRYKQRAQRTFMSLWEKFLNSVHDREKRVIIEADEYSKRRTFSMRRKYSVGSRIWRAMRIRVVVSNRGPSLSENVDAIEKGVSWIMGRVCITPRDKLLLNQSSLYSVINSTEIKPEASLTKHR